MGPKPATPETDELFISRLDELINMRHPLARVAGLVGWAEIERTFAFTSALDQIRRGTLWIIKLPSHACKKSG